MTEFDSGAFGRTIKAAWAVLYACRPPTPLSPVAEEVEIMDPPPVFRIGSIDILMTDQHCGRPRSRSSCPDPQPWWFLRDGRSLRLCWRLLTLTE